MMEKALIQVVEDNRIIALGIQSTLNSQGYDVSSIVSSGEEAVKKAEEDNPDLVLMDIVLEGEMDGIEAAEQIRSRFNIPVVFLTAYTDEKKLERAKLTEPFGYIIKPFEDRELHFIIEIALFRYKIERRLKESEEQLKASLKEKEALLKEIHHRVKNNMQIIHSLLNIQSRQIKDKDILNMLKETQHRVRSMALIHEKLYQSKDLSKIEFGDYIRKLVFDLFHMYGVDSNSIKLKINVENVYLDINAAIPCGLIINELVSNSLKHAFPEGKVWGERGCTKGKIHIRLSSDKNNKYTLIVCDNGVGFPEDLDFRKTESLGMQLVNILVEQLEGNIELRRKDGTTFKITFK